MGREAICHCKWGNEEGDCKVLLESRELILRHGLRRRVSLSSLAGVSVQGGTLVFRVGEDCVELDLGSEVAQRWAKALTSPLPTLAGKLGISPAAKLSVIGEVQSEELKKAIAEGSTAQGKDVDLTLICVDSQTAVDHTLAQWFKGNTSSGPLWIVFPKGASSEVKESAVRELLRRRGFIDTKIASVSTKLTAIRFNKSKGQISVP
jgi:hypothetical protein